MQYIGENKEDEVCSKIKSLVFPALRELWWVGVGHQ